MSADVGEWLFPRAGVVRPRVRRIDGVSVPYGV